MNNRSGPPVALVCGSLRDPVEFGLVARRLEAARADGLVGRVLASLWAPEAAADPGVVASLQRLGWDVVLSEPPPAPRDETVLPGHLAHQKASLRAGLEFLDPDERVLKLRTDKCLPALSAFLQTLIAPPSLDVEHRHFDDRVFQSKIMVESAHVFVPFWMNDIVFFGTARDLWRLTEFTPRFWFRRNHVSAEALWFSSPFTAMSPAVSQLMTNADWGALAARLRTGNLDLEPGTSGARVLLYWLGVWFLILDEYFSFRASRFAAPSTSLGDFRASPDFHGVNTEQDIYFSRFAAVFLSPKALAGVLDNTARGNKTDERLSEVLAEARAGRSLERLPLVGGAEWASVADDLAPEGAARGYWPRQASGQAAAPSEAFETGFTLTHELEHALDVAALYHARAHELLADNPNSGEAADWLRRAGFAGRVDAFAELAFLLQNRGDTPPAAVFELANRAADGGSRRGVVELAAMLHAGHGCGRNPSRARALLAGLAPPEPLNEREVDVMGRILGVTRIR